MLDVVIAAPHGSNAYVIACMLMLILAKL